MDIQLRLIQEDSITDRENYFILQNSVTLFPSWNKKNHENMLWKAQFKNPNRICYVIEEKPELIYCGECAIKDISADIPEIEIELMPEYQKRGVGYQSIVYMLNTIAEKYGKRDFYARVEPDNYASQFLIEKLGGTAIGVIRDFKVSDKRIAEFTEKNKHLLNDRMKILAQMFSVEEEVLLTHLLVYQIHAYDGKILTGLEREKIHRAPIRASRRLTKEKYKETLIELNKDLEELKELIGDESRCQTKFLEIEKKILDKEKRIQDLNVDDLIICQ